MVFKLSSKRLSMGDLRVVFQHFQTWSNITWMSVRTSIVLIIIIASTWRLSNIWRFCNVPFSSLSVQCTIYLTKIKQPCMHINYNNVHQLIADIISFSCQPWYWECNVIHFCLKHSISIQVGYFINNNGGESRPQPGVQWSCQEVKIFTLFIFSSNIFSTELRRRTWRRLRSPGVCTRRGWTSSGAPSSSSSARSDIT